MATERITNAWVRTFLEQKLLELDEERKGERKKIRLSTIIPGLAQKIPRGLRRLGLGRSSRPDIGRLVMMSHGPDTHQLVLDCYDTLWEIGSRHATRHLNIAWAEWVVTSFLEFEWLLHQQELGEKRYRDHFFHAVKVGALGQFLLDSCLLSDGSRLADHLAERLAQSPEPKAILDRSECDDQDHVTSTWWLTALTHDLGYPYQFYRHGERKLRGMFGATWGPPYMPTASSPFAPDEATAADAMADVLIHGMRVSGTRADLVRQSCHAFTTDEPAFQKNHGIMGAMFLLVSRPAEMSAQMSGLDRLAAAQAAWAVFLHDNPRAVFDFDSDPLPYLLYFSDEVQEWGRSLCLCDAEGKLGSRCLIRQPREIDRLELVYGESGSSRITAQFVADTQGISEVAALVPGLAFRRKYFEKGKEKAIDKLSTHRGAFPRLEYDLLPAGVGA